MDSLHISAVTEEGSLSRLHSFLMAASKIKPSRVSPIQILEAMEVSEHHLNVTHVSDSKTLAASTSQLGIIWALTLASCLKTKIILQDGWEGVLWKMIELAKHWLPRNVDSSEMRSILKPWILSMFTDRHLCPNPYLRLEMLRFIGMWPETYLQDATSGRQAAAGLVATSTHLELDHLLGVDSQMTLFYPLIKVLHSLSKYGHMNAVATAAMSQMRSLRVGPEASFYNRLVQLLKQKAEATLARYQSGTFNAMLTLNVCSNILRLFKLMVLPPTTVVYGVPGLAEAAALSLVSITSSIVTLVSRSQNQNERSCLWLVSYLDNIYKTISEQDKFRLISLILRRDHAEFLASLQEQGTDSRFSFHHFPTPREESKEECPEEFVDGVTQAMMEAPVLLHSSKMVVDASTLLLLLLESPVDPFTRCPLDPGSYSRLPNLQADIRAWRNASSGLHDFTNIEDACSDVGEESNIGNIAVDDVNNDSNIDDGNMSIVDADDDSDTSFEEVVEIGDEDVDVCELCNLYYSFQSR